MSDTLILEDDSRGYTQLPVHVCGTNSRKLALEACSNLYFVLCGTHNRAVHIMKACINLDMCLGCFLTFELCRDPLRGNSAIHTIEHCNELLGVTVTIMNYRRVLTPIARRVSCSARFLSPVLR